MGDVNIKLLIGNTILQIISLSAGPIDHIPMHIHGNESYELHYISSGKGILKTNGQEYALNPGNLYLTGPEISHEQIGDRHDPMSEYCIYYTIHSKTTEIEDNSFALTLLSHKFWFGTITPLILSPLLKLFEEASIGLLYYEQDLQFIAGDLFVNLARAYHNTALLPSTRPKLSPEDKRFLIIEREFLSNYYKITPKYLSQKLGLSIRQLQRLLRNYYGMTFQQMRMKARLNASALLLKTSSLSITAIAEQTGFSSVEYYGSCFHKEFNMSAKTYRKNA